ncbi:VOC family protein [Paraburkholderia sp. B3]|uniref:VOC family protein n=1 Tax=Paraburkholderia sp. B3 TaxID=3134791 RepID=UPI003981BB6E
MTLTAFSHYNLRADRATLDTLRDFYVNVVGLRLGERPPFSSFGYWLYAGSKDVLHLSVAGPGEERDTTARNTFDHAAFACTDLQGTMAQLQRFKVPFTCADVPLTGQRQIFFSDPAGNGVELNFAREDV